MLGARILRGRRRPLYARSTPGQRQATKNNRGRDVRPHFVIPLGTSDKMSEVRQIGTVGSSLGGGGRPNWVFQMSSRPARAGSAAFSACRCHSLASERYSLWVRGEGAVGGGRPAARRSRPLACPGFGYSNLIKLSPPVRGELIFASFILLGSRSNTHGDVASGWRQDPSGRAVDEAE
jgi:hypothetical protein